MLKLVQFFRANRWRTAMVGTLATALLVAAGGWAVAAFMPGHNAARLDMTVAALHAATGATARISQNRSQPGQQAATPQGGTSQTAPQVGGLPAAKTLPAGMLAIGSPASLGLSLHANPASPADHSATGGGTALFFHLGFTAQSHRNGKVAATVSGNAQFTFFPPTKGDVHVQLNCLQIVGADAYMSGTLVKPVFGLPAGTEILFGVQDDDSAAKPDLMSDIFVSPTTAIDCLTFHALPHYGVQGNIEIH